MAFLVYHVYSCCANIDVSSLPPSRSIFVQESPVGQSPPTATPPSPSPPVPVLVPLIAAIAAETASTAEGSQQHAQSSYASRKRKDGPIPRKEEEDEGESGVSSRDSSTREVKMKMTTTSSPVSSPLLVPPSPPTKMTDATTTSVAPSSPASTSTSTSTITTTTDPSSWPLSRPSLRVPLPANLIPMAYRMAQKSQPALPTIDRLFNDPQAHGQGNSSGIGMNGAMVNGRRPRVHDALQFGIFLNSVDSSLPDHIRGGDSATVDILHRILVDTV